MRGQRLLIDISDPANPRRIDAVADPVYADWPRGHFFSNDGKTVVFTDERSRRHEPALPGGR